MFKKFINNRVSDALQDRTAQLESLVNGLVDKATATLKGSITEAVAQLEVIVKTSTNKINESVRTGKDELSVVANEKLDTLKADLLYLGETSKTRLRNVADDLKDELEIAFKKFEADLKETANQVKTDILADLKKETEGTLDTAVAGMRGAMEAILENAKAEMKGYVDALKNDK